MGSSRDDDHTKSGGLLHTIFESQVSSSPDRDAIQTYTLGSSRAITYYELNSKANKIARLLQSTKSPQVSTIAICMDKGPTLVAVVLAVLKLGCAWSPVDPKAPAKRKITILQELGNCHLLVTPSYAVDFQHCPPSTGVFVWDDSSSTAVNFQSSDNIPGIKCSPESPCHILWTSGSTGVPKGVVIPHQSVVNNASALTQLFRLRSETRTLQFAHFTFDIFALDLFMTLGIGGCLIMGDVSEMLTDLSSFMDSTQTTYAQLTPSVIQLLDPERVDSNGSLRILASSGEVMTEGIVRIWADRVQLFNCYGPTETDVVTAHRMTAETSPSCIGRETAGCKVTIRDDQGTVLPLEMIGEICVSGIQVMSGYLNASEETNWHSQSPEGRIYRTGDRGKISSSGDVFCLGRKDHEVKVRGSRVNLAEIEETIRHVPDVRSTAVVFPNAGFLQGQLCCFLQADLEEQNSRTGTVLSLELNTSEEAICMTEVVLKELQQLLPTPEVPTSWWLIRRLPLTSSGKVDRQALLQWLESSADSELQLRTHPAGFSSSSKCVDTDESSPEEAERTIRLIWSKLLGVHSSKVSANRSFFASGGHSLLAVRLVAAMRAQGVDFTMKTLHESDTIRKQAILLTRSEKLPEPTSRREAEVPYALIDAEIDQHKLKEAVSKVCSVPQKVIDNIYPCTPMQCGLMVASLQRPGMYISDMSLSTRDRLNRSAFDVAWSQLVNLEPIFRTRIALIPEYGMFQIVLTPEYAVDSIETHPCHMGIGSRLWQYVFEESVVHFRIHHSILDGAQVSLMLDKLGTLYDLAVPSNKTQPSQARLDSMRGTPFTHFLHFVLRAASSSGSRNFWLKTMKDQSPTDYPTVTSAVPKYSTSRTLSSTIQWKYRELAAKSDVPPGALLAALWSFVYSGFADAATIVYGMVLSGRDAAVDGIEKIVAPTIAITPFIAAIDPEVTFAHLAAAHQKALSDMVPHRHFGLQHIQALGSSYRTACDFRTLLVIESEIDHPVAEGPLVLEGVSEARYDYPLVLSLTMKANQVVAFELRYEETFISGEEVQCILSRLKDVSQQLEDLGVQQNLKSLQTPSQAHLQHIVASTTAPSAKKMYVQDIFHNAALKTPEESAMFDQELGVSLTYSEVERLSGLLARVIIKCGAETGSIVPLCIENSAYAILGILAVHQAGCAYVPIDLEHPAKRQYFVLEQVHANVLLCTSGASANYTHFAGQIINVDEIIPITSEQSEGSTASAWDMVEEVEERSHGNTTNLEEQAQFSLPGDSRKRSSDTAFVLFTSGSTGQPKGVELTHQNIATAIHYLINSFQLEQGIRIFQFASLTFDASLLEIYGAWARCGCLCIPSKYSRMNRTSESLREMRVDTVFATVTVASLFRVEDASHLRTMVVFGERLSRGIVDRWSARLRLYQIYGPTECGISVTSTRLLPDCVELHNIGLAVNARIWILDEDRKSVPSGYPGEIAISGPTVARGYLNDPEKTKNAFITVMPSGKKESEQRVYLTGDIGRRTEDGMIRIYGRKDHQVKIRGIRVELGEIEDSILAAACEVSSVAVAYISNKLVAFLNDGMVATDDEQSIFDEMTSNREAMVSKIRAHLKARLPTYMTTSRFLFTTRWPKTSGGKTDRNALSAAYQTEEFGGRSFSKEDPGSLKITPDDSPERTESKSFSRFRRILHRVLGLPYASRIDPLDTFFELGGDSFAAMNFVAAAHEDNLEISVRDIYHDPTLSAMHDLMFEKESEATEDVRQASSDVQRFLLKDFVDPQEVENLTGLALDLLEDIYPCTPFQEGVAALASSHEDLYVTRHVFSITPCDQARFTAALALVIKHTPILRTTIMFSKTLGALQVVIGPECPSSPPIRFHASVTDLTSQPVQLQGKYLYNFDLVGRDGAVKVFAVTISHAAFDGWSQELLLDDISKAYCEGFLPSPLATFSQFISFQHQRSKDPRNKEFWSAYLANAQASSWPHEPSNGHMLVCANQRYSTTAKVAWPSQLELRPAILRGAWALLLAKYENTSNPCFATIFSGRMSDFPYIESVRGPTMSAAVTHVSLKKGETVAGFLKRQQEDFVAMLPHSAHGLQNIKTVSEDAANACQLRTMLVIQFAEIQRSGSARQIRFDLIHESMLQGYAVTLECVPTKEGIKLCISYDAAWIHDKQVERLARQYLHVVEQISTRMHDQSTLHDVDMVPPQDFEQIQQWNLAELKPQKQNIYELVQAAMRKYPHSPAIEGSGGQVISYRDVELHVCAVADILKKNGVKARDRVLIRMAKSIHQIVALLAIVRVGATFVPIDVEWPHGRIRRIAEDTAAAFAIVDEGKPLFETPLSLQEIAVDVLPSTLPIQACSHDPTDLVQPEDLAYILFTSGSTGEPKGILTPHIAVCTTLHAHQDHLDLSSDSRVFHFSSLTFDPSIIDIFGTLSIGGCICVPNEHERAFELESTILERRANWLHLTPSVAGLLNPENLPTVKTLVVGGESVPQSLTDTWVDKVHLIYTYGPTETTVSITACHNSRDPHCIGNAMGTTSTWIVDPSNHTRLAPIGAVGELLCIGPSTADGYLNDTVGTAKAFVKPPPWVDRQSKVWKAYRTGDLVRYNADSSIRILGRADGQLKIRGKRVELAEIDAAIKRTGFVDQVVTDVIRRNGTPLLVSFITIVLSDDADASASDTVVLRSSKARGQVIRDIRSSIQQILPVYVQPWAVIPVNKVPLSSSGKVDRRMLRSIAEEWSPEDEGATGKAAEASDAKHMSPSELTMQGLWSEVLGIERQRIDPNNTFARLGGDSLGLMRLVSGLRARGYVVDVKRIHQGLALNQMAPLLVGQGIGREVREAPTVEPFSMLEDSSVASLRESIRQHCHVSLNAVVDIYPLSPMQMALIALSAKIPGSYTNKITFKLERYVDLDQLEGVVRQAVEHQEILRTVFVANVQGLSVQAVLRHGPAIQRRSCPKDTGELFDNGEIPQVHAPAAFYLEKTDNCVYLTAIIHHAAMDGASLQMLADDLHCAYSSQPLPERPAYRTFIKHLETIHSKDDSRKVWKAFFDRPLPTQAPTPEILETMEQPGQRKVQVKMSSLTESEWSSSEILVAALALLLRQTSGASSICFGLVLSGRMENITGIENIAGPTFTTIPMICDIEPMLSKETLLRGLREDLRNIRTHEQFGLRNISKLNDCARQAASFTTLMVVQPKRKAKELGAFSDYTCKALRPTTQNPLEVECNLSEGAAEIIMAYDGKVVGATEADWLINHFKRIIEKELYGDTELMKPFQDTVMLTDEDENQIDAWNSTVIGLETRPLHACFSETAAKYPERVAVVSHDASYTYAELDRLSSILARHLVSHGVNRCDMVPLMFEKSAIVIVAILAILKTGAAYVSLDPLHPRARLQSIKNDIGADIILCSPPMRGRCQLWDNKILLDHPLLLQLQSQEQLYHLTSAVSPEDPAYIMFTSGSSGQPKGVVISHGAASTSIRDQVSAFCLAPGTRIMNFCTYTFDVSVMEIFATLSSGATLFVPSEEERTSHLAQYMHDKSIQTAILTPTVVRSFLTPERVPSLQQLILVGEPCSQKLILEWSSRVQLINDYGPTETTIDSATNTDVTENTKATNVGKPISGHLWITREAAPGQLCPLGVVGELLISGPTLATGYLHDPERTSQAFLDGSDLPWTHKMTAKPRRLYKTGDLAKYSANGGIHILGRIDSQIKLKGLRIEAQEIEHVLELFDASVRAGVVLTKLASGEDSLFAVVSKEEWRRDSEPSILELTGEMRTWVDGLFEHSARLLPVYMRPAIIVPLTNFPTNVSGKLDRRKLGRIAESLREKKWTSYQSQPSSNDCKTTVLSQAESDLRDQWAQVLGADVNQIYPDSSFFSMGGDSLTAMKLSSAYDTNRRLSVKSIFQHPTLGAMAKAIETVALGDATAPDAAIRQHYLPRMRFSKSLFENVAAACNVFAQEVEDIYPCSPLQENLFAASLLSSGSYQARIAFDLAPEVDLNRFCASWEAVYQNTPILRTRIVPDHQERTQYLQVVIRQHVQWRTVDTEEKATERPEVTLGGELAQWTLLNGRVRQFVLFIHHALYDDVTLGIIFSDFAQLYTKGYLETRPSLLGMKHYIGFVESLDESGMIKVWKDLLAGANALPFPPRKSPDYQPLTDRASHTLTARASGGDSWRSDQTSLLRAAWMLTIARHQHAVSDGESVCFGTVLSGRTMAVPGLEEVAGPMILSVPVVEIVRKTDSLSDFLGRVREKYVRAMDCGFLGLKKIRSIGPDHTSACNFNNLFIIQKGENEEDFLQKERVEGFRILKRELSQPYGLVLECNFTATGINFSAWYDSALLDEVAMYRLLDHFGTAFERLTELRGSSTAKVSDILSRLSGNAEASLVEAWNEQPATPDCLLHERFLTIAQEWPTREAVFAHDRSLTYEELDGESSSLAYELIDLGVQAGSMVPICFEKSSYMLVALLAILKAGGAYVPISPDHPRKRQEYIIEKCSTGVILASTDQVGLLRNTLGTDKTLVCVDQHFFKCHPAIKTFQPPRGCTSPTSKSLAYVLYTSGSTGTPKGVAISHGAVALSMVRHAECFGHALGDSVRSLQFCDYTFDVSIMDIFPTLSYGGCVCIPSEADRLSNISSFVNKSRAEMAMLTPTVTDMLDPAEVPTLRTLVIGGEPMTESVRNKWTDPANTPMRVLYNVYGPTEASVNVSAFRMTSKSKTSIIGSAVLGSQLWIAEPDDTDRLTPLGCVGELIIIGSCLADGYLHAPDQTAKAFIKAPTWLATRFGSTAYRTGDLARFAANGEIEIFGRIDAQVKIHGIRIELGEIAEVACRVEHVKSAVAIVSKTRGRKELSLFYDAAQEQQSNLRKAVHEQLISSLPPAFIPSIYICSAIPMTRTGKIDRKALARQLEGYRPEELSTFVIDASDSVKRSPETEKHKELRILWIRALRVREEDVWLDTNFFSIGGDSVAIIGLVSMMQRAGYLVTYKDVYARPTLENMALLMQKAGEEYNTLVDPEPFEILAADPANRHGLKTHLANALGISTDRIRDAYPCSAMQKSLIAASLRNPKAYWCTITLELASDIDVERLLSSWGAVVMHNAILRTVIVNTEDFGNVQVVIDADPWKSIGECHEDVQLLSQPLSRYSLGTSRAGQKVFQLTMHHAIYDLWVLEALLKQLSQLYNGGRVETNPSFSRFIRFQQQADDAAAFWKRAMQGASVVKFPNCRIVQDPNEAFMTLSAERPMRLPYRRTSAHSLATIIHCAYALVLSRYGYMSDVCFPSVQSGRNISLQNASNIVGPLMTTSFFRADCSHDRTVSEMLKSASQFLLDATNYQHAAHTVVPQLFDQSIVDMGSMLVVQPRAHVSKSRSNLFSRTSAEMAQPGLLLVEATIEEETKVTLKIQYAPEAMQQGNAQLFLSHLQQAIVQLLAEPDMGAKQTLGSITLLTEKDEQIAMRGCGMAMPSSTETVVDVMWRIADKDPNAVAVKAHDGTLTYGELRDQASRLAALLRRRLMMHAGREVRIAACSERNAMAVVIQAAIFTVRGAAFIPLDPTSPVERNVQILEDSEADIVLVSPYAMDVIEQIARGRDVIQVSRHMLDELSADDGSDSTDAKPQRDNVAYLIYTSGSTGQPKGCIMEHGPLAITISKLTEFKEIDANVNTLWASTWSFDVHLSQIWEPLTTGGVICVPSEAEMYKGAEATLVKYDVNHAFFTPTQAGVIDFSKTPCVRSIAMGGEPISFDLAPIFKAGIRIFNEYGPSEAAGCVTGHELTLGDQEKNKMGRALFGNCWAVEPGNPCRLAPIGTIGELVAGGTLARGYLNRPELTREAFFESPAWARDVCPRLYRTGDLVCQDLDGSFRYLGRADTQVKINGVRIEVAEIESRIAEIDSSVTAFVAALRSGDEEESKTLVAFISDDVSQKLSIPIRTEAFQEKSASIRRELAQILPRIMVPRVWIPLANVKRTPTGKVDRKALQKVFEIHKKMLSTEKPSNRNEILTDAEKTMRSLWVSVVKCDQSKIHKSTNFFDLGDSITAISLVAAAARFGYHISVGSLFKNSGLSEMALLIQDNNSTDSLKISQDPPSFSLLTLDALNSAREDLVLGLPAHITLVDIYPVTPLQEMALVANQRWHHAYYAWFLVELTGALDPSRLQDACNQLIDIHPILRTIFFQSGATLYQAPLRNVKPDYQETPWDGEKLRVPTLIERSCSNERRSFCSPTRFRLLQHSATHSLLAIGLSHAQYDGVCLSNVFGNLITIYNGNRVARQPSFSRLVQFLNLPTQVAEAQAFWSKRLRGSSMTKPVGDLNINRPLLDSIVTEHIRLPTLSTIKRSFHAVLCLAWAITLGSATGVSDVVFGTLTSGRNASIKDISTLDGPCITTIPVRVKLDKHPPANSSADTMTLGQALEQVHRDHIETLPYEHLGLRRIVKGCTDWPSTTRFSSMVQHQNIGIWDPSSTTSASPTRPAADGDLQWRNRGSIAYKGACDEVDLWITSLPMGEDGMKVRILFSQDALPREVVESLLSVLCANLKSILRNTDESVTTLSAMSIARLGGVRLPIELPYESRGPAQNETTSFTPEAPSQTSRSLEDIWCRVLELAPDKQFAASDSFYTQGGDSMGAAMVAGLAQAEGLSLNTQDVAECETFGAQVRRIEQGCRGVGRKNDLEWDVTDRMWGKDG